MLLSLFATSAAAAVAVSQGPPDHTLWFIGGATVFATLLGPILAVQAQKALEAYRERMGRKVWVFTQLMMTRQQRLSPDHVRALNLIDLTFYGHKVLGLFHHRKRLDDEVINAWRTYRTRLTGKPDGMTLELWGSKHTESFFSLLKAMSLATGYKFADADLETSSYAPQAFADRDDREDEMRDLAVRVLKGQQALTLNVSSFPEPTAEGRVLQGAIVKLGAAVDDDGLKVVLKDGTGPDREN